MLIYKVLLGLALIIFLYLRNSYRDELKDLDSKLIITTLDYKRIQELKSMIGSSTCFIITLIILLLWLQLFV